MSEMTLMRARHGPFPGRLGTDEIAAYAAATANRTVAVPDGRAVPAVFPVLLVFTPQEAARADVRANRLGSITHHIDEQLAHRYAELSGDWSAHDFDIEVARAAGFDFVFAHGLCTMAICTHRVLGLLGVGDPGRVARVAVRFASPTPLGTELTINAYGIDDRRFAFDASAGGVTTISHGRLELRT
jgi:acyl dehydratase